MRRHKPAPMARTTPQEVLVLRAEAERLSAVVAEMRQQRYEIDQALMSYDLLLAYDGEQYAFVADDEVWTRQATMAALVDYLRTLSSDDRAQARRQRRWAMCPPDPRSDPRWRD